MKVQLKLDSAAIKDFFLNHGEKVGLGVVVLVLIMFVWSAARHVVGNAAGVKTPEQVAAKATLASNHITAGTYQAQTPPSFNIDHLLGGPKVDLESQLLATDVTWDPPLSAARNKRVDPDIFPVLELQGSAGHGALVLKDANSSVPAVLKRTADYGAGSGAIGVGYTGPGTPKAVYYAVLTGLVQVAKQEQEYERRFPDVHGPRSPQDRPVYTLFELERAEVPPPGGAPNWTPIDLKAALADAENWADIMPDMLDHLLTDPKAYTWPLPPIRVHEWHLGEVGHPMLLKSRISAGETPATSAAADNNRGIRIGSNRNESPAGSGASATKTGTSQELNREFIGPEFKLFRFIDLTVEAGKRYQYRVRLELRNPNFGVEEQFLENPKVKPTELLYSAWSEPSLPIAVSTDAQILPEKLETGARTGLEAHLTLLVWDHPSAREIKAQTRATLGQAVHATGKALTIDPKTMIREDIPNFDYHSRLTLVDLRNSDVTPGKADLPDLMFIDSTGQLVVADGEADKYLLDEVQKRFESMAASKIYVEPPEKSLGPDSKKKPPVKPKPPPRTRNTNNTKR